LAALRPWRPSPRVGVCLTNSPSPSTTTAAGLGEGVDGTAPTGIKHPHSECLGAGSDVPPQPLLQPIERPAQADASLDPICHLTQRGPSPGHEGDPCRICLMEPADAEVGAPSPEWLLPPQATAHPVTPCNGPTSKNSPAQGSAGLVNPAHPGCGPGHRLIGEIVQRWQRGMASSSMTIRLAGGTRYEHLPPSACSAKTPAVEPPS